MGFFSKKKKDENATGASVGSVVLESAGEVDLKGRIDCLGDSCPRPQLMTKKALTNAESGDVYVVLIDNPSSMEAIPPMMPGLGATHLETVKADRCWQVYVQKN
ncbi:MAG: sulfurtransferase TusA family protein [Hyphomicrobiales bacterium]|nr:sulfurtransferase TusA family protein [Hyphomicrobiales bacterium]